MIHFALLDLAVSRKFKFSMLIVLIERYKAQLVTSYFVDNDWG